METSSLAIVSDNETNAANTNTGRIGFSSNGEQGTSCGDKVPVADYKLVDLSASSLFPKLNDNLLQTSNDRETRQSVPTAPGK